MAMDFLERLAQLASSLLLLLLLNCQPTTIDSYARVDSALKIQIGDANLKQGGPILYYKSVPLTGLLFSINNTDTLSKQLFLEGKEHGVSVTWNNMGKKIEEREYKKGKRVGIHQGWHSNGSLKFKYEYKDDFMHGLAEEWFINGNKFREMHYIKGAEEGMQRMWEEDGSIRANYEARNGRNYGLTGIKSCKNVWEDVAL